VVVATEPMPNLVGGDTERCCSKLKTCKRFSEPNFETLPKLRQVRQVQWWSIEGSHYLNLSRD
jgi:hypothetical protein